MGKTIHYTNCPVCGSDEIQYVFSVKDFTVSGETFPLAACKKCSLRFTQDIPAPEESKAYYRSEDYISHTDSSKGLINRLYLRVRKRTMKKKRKLVEKISGRQTGMLLDVGSGTGTFVSTMQGRGWEATGLEPDAGARELGEKIYGVKLYGDKKLYELPAESFDVITLWHVLEHVYGFSAFIQQLKSLLKKDGKLIVAVPNYTSYDAAIYREHWAAYDVPRHLYHFSPAAMERFAELKDLKILKMYPMWYDSFYISLLSSKYKNGSSRWLPALWIAFCSNIHAWGNIKKCSSLIYVFGK
jgi:2-polyprenyl-3-methyl-5-hydroxy-6-metoxy-1,4-benzoquinol methylase